MIIREHSYNMIAQLSMTIDRRFTVRFCIRTKLNWNRSILNNMNQNWIKLYNWTKPHWTDYFDLVRFKIFVWILNLYGFIICCFNTMTSCRKVHPTYGSLFPHAIPHLPHPRTTINKAQNSFNDRTKITFRQILKPIKKYRK